MQTIKTAISVDRTLFEQAEEIARDMKVSRSKLFVLALQEYIEHRKSKELLAQINSASEEEAAPSEERLRQKSRYQHRKLVEGDW
ncbi:MAG TPA: hypothetical protein VJ550_13660 [Geomonas sp.]|nr:hypothetical protein [Geomonas sp.]